MARGYNALADVLRTADGVDVNRLFAEIQQAVARAQRAAAAVAGPPDLPHHPAQRDRPPGRATPTPSRWRRPPSTASRRVSGSPATSSTMGARAKWYDIGARFTYRGLADMPASQVQAVTNAALEADGKKVYELVMSQLFRPTNTQFTESGVAMTEFTFWNGDGAVPPTYNGQSFDGTHTHFRTSGAATVQSGRPGRDHHRLQVPRLQRRDRHADGPARQPRRGRRSSTASASRTAPRRTSSRLRVPGSSRRTTCSASSPPRPGAGSPVKGAYGELLVIEDSRVPAGYMVGLASGGENVRPRRSCCASTLA